MLREATLNDEKDVINLDPDVQWGTDFLYYHYPQILLNPKMKCFVYEEEGRLVGFLALQMLDGGQTVRVTLGRIVKDRRRKGLFIQMTKLAMEEMKQYKSLRCVVMTTDNVNLAVNGQRILKYYRPILEREVTLIELDIGQIRTRLPSSGYCKREQPTLNFDLLSSDDINFILRQGSKQMLNFFPEERVFLNFCPYRLMEANQSSFFAWRTKTVASTHNKPEGTPDANPDAVPTPDQEVTVKELLSAGNHYACKRGRAYILDIFGPATDEELRAHLEWHALRLAEDSNSKCDFNGFMYVVFHKRLDDIVQEMQGEYSMWVSTEIMYRKMVSFERKFPFD